MDRNFRDGIIVLCIILISVLVITKVALMDTNEGISPILYSGKVI
jgi:hypothetical protein